jgi:ABC-type transport system involved in multi-copper enzyme maturation permease subunit
LELDRNIVLKNQLFQGRLTNNKKKIMKYYIIIQHELMSSIKTLKIQVGFIITIGMVIISTYININDYEMRQQEYLDAVQNTKTDYGTTVYKIPHVLSVFVKGKDSILGNKASLDPSYIPLNTTKYFDVASVYRENLFSIESVDYTYIVKMILCLMVIFLVYDTISGEKAQGTLKLILSNNIPRHVILLGKVISGIVLILMALIISTIIAILMMLLSQTIELRKDDMIRILFMFCASSIYLLFFFTIGLWASVLFNRSSSALLFLLQYWIVVLFIIPNLSIFISDSAYNLPDEAERNYKTRLYGSELANRDEVKRLNLFEKLNLSAEIVYKDEKEYDNELTHQSNIAQKIALISPSVLFENIMDRLARTGIDEHQRFIDAMYQYWDAVYRVRSTDTRDSYKQRTDNPPIFQYFQESINVSIIRTMPGILVFILLDIFFFTISYVSFLKKDVR